jgi:dTDP-4-dehydrorhamnose reductase
MDKLNVLILGDGLLGSEIIKQTNWPYVSRKKGNFDIDDITLSLKNHKSKIIINCIANTDTYSNDRDGHWQVNCVYLKNLIDYCNKTNIKLVHISTDYIYSGSSINASELDVPVHSNNWYGYTKLIGDALVQLISFDYLIIRCTHKPNPFPYNSAWIDQVGNFDYVDVIADLIIKLINSNVSGVFNIGTDTKTIYELAIKTNPLVNKSFRPSHVPHNTSMCIDKLKSIL